MICWGQLLVLKDLARPFVYLRIQHPGKQFAWVNWWAPAIAGGFCTLVAVGLIPGANVYGQDGLLVKLLGFIQSLPGFFLAALAVVATFQLASLDKKMPGEPPTVSIIYNGKPIAVDLTRRRMLCLMFSYLTALSFGITFILIVVTTFAEPLRAVLAVAMKGELVVSVMHGFGLFVLTLATFQLVTITLWGLYYMGERMHTPDN